MSGGWDGKPVMWANALRCAQDTGATVFSEQFLLSLLAFLSKLG